MGDQAVAGPAAQPATETLPQLPFPREEILGLAPQWAQLRQTRPVTRVRTPVGDVGWAVTGYHDVKALLADPRVGRSHPDPSRAARYSSSALEGGPIGDDASATDAAYAQMRQLISPSFSPRRMRAARERIGALVDELLTEVQQATPPVDLHKTLTYPLPVMVVCQLLGVPISDRAQFQSWFDATTALYDDKLVADGFTAVIGYMDELVKVKRAEPGEDIISDLLASEQELQVDYLATLAAGLLYAGHETTVERLDYGVTYLLADPEQREALAREPDRLPGTVEEVLRLGAPNRPPRILYAREDMAFGGAAIEAGDLVMLMIQAANRDPSVFPDPDRFDATRSPNQHLAFGHGAHFCLGASLARIEMELVFTAIAQRCGHFQLAVPVAQMRQYENPATGGLDSLPVRW